MKYRGFEIDKIGIPKGYRVFWRGPSGNRYEIGWSSLLSRCKEDIDFIYSGYGSEGMVPYFEFSSGDEEALRLQILRHNLEEG